MKTEVIAIGTEILMGYITNTNSRDISQALLDIGIGTYYQSVIGDNQDRILDTLEKASKRSDIIILAGGLGPTEDDITKFALAEFLNEELIQDERQVKKIQDYFAQNNRTVTENNYRQSLTITNGHTLTNEVGLATGLIYEKERENSQNQYYIVLPGPPFEMNHMFNNYVKPYLMSRITNRGVIESEYINLYGIGEAKVANDLDDLISSQENPTIAVYAQPRKVTVRLTANAETIEKAHEMNRHVAEKIVKRLKKHFIGYGQNQTLESYILELLIQQRKSLSAAESMTGGLILKSLTDIPGATNVIKGGLVTYRNEVKTEVLGVKQATLDEFTVVSAQVATEMAEKVRKLMDSDFAIGVTGAAGPESLEGSKPGIVFIALAREGKETIIKKLNIPNRPREVIRDITKNEALLLLKKNLE